jgi:preprotein translocase subunit SecB
MAKTTDTPQNGDNERIEAEGLPVTIHAQYVRDISFENPNAPGALRGNLGMPEMDINIGMDARALQEEGQKNLFEVALNVRAVAKRGEDTVFIAELQYGVVVSIGESVPEETHHPLLFIEIPRLVFPYARQIMSDLTIQGGYPPLLLNPVDFHALYMQRYGKEIEAARRQFEGDAKKAVADDAKKK